MPVFIAPNKKGTVSFITDYRNINNKLVRKPHQLPTIGKTVKQINGLHYVTLLFINTG